MRGASSAKRNLGLVEAATVGHVDRSEMKRRENIDYR
jgi:hypothetical protein